jgi:adhesin/invasin
MRSTFIFFGIFLSAFFVWYCSGNPPLAPEETTKDQFVIFVGVNSSPKTVSPGDRSVISALLLDQNNRPVAGEEIRFSTDFGSLSSLVSTTDDSGFSIVTFTAPTRSGTATITATWNSVTHQSKVDVKNTSAETAQIVPDQSSLLANGLTKTMVRSFWRNSEGDALKGMRIEFEVDQGTIVSPVFTDSTGLALTE